MGFAKGEFTYYVIERGGEERKETGKKSYFEREGKKGEGEKEGLLWFSSNRERIFFSSLAKEEMRVGGGTSCRLEKIGKKEKGLLTSDGKSKGEKRKKNGPNHWGGRPYIEEGEEKVASSCANSRNYSALYYGRKRIGLYRESIFF